MSLSRHLEGRLTECFITKVSKPRDLRFSFVVGGQWYCPGCGVPTIEENGFVRCTQCGLTLNEFMHSLVEHHPHKEKGDHTDWPKRNA